MASRSVGSGGKGPASRVGGRSTGPGGRAGLSVTGRGGGQDRRTSPSHLFFPLRQAVQARAPRLGMWTDCWPCASSELPGPCGEWTIWLPFVLMLCVLRRFEGKSEWLEREDGDMDIVL